MKKVKVDVVLSAYKKLDALQMQLEAIRDQTYEIQNIYLFKDGIDSYYDFVLKNTILEQFDDVCISETNKGVWERFEYAFRKCESECVCIFDDDTIPGKKWIENCVANYCNQPGIYGTNGVIVSKPELYPYKMYNVGWHAPNYKTKRVDFVGHSWFLKKDWLQWMLELRGKYKYKYIGEDMVLSYACQLHGINTYVPAHPYTDVQMWGSKPLYGKIYGLQSSAISADGDNLTKMNELIVRLYEDGWHFLINEDKDCIIDNIETTDNKKDVIANDIRHFAACHKSFFIYGAGNYGKIVYNFLRGINLEITGFVVTETNENQVNVNGRSEKIISLEKLNQYKEAGVILALNKIHHYSILEKLGKNISVFMNDDTAYSFDEMLDLIKMD